MVCLSLVETVLPNYEKMSENADGGLGTIQEGEGEETGQCCTCKCTTNPQTSPPPQNVSMQCTCTNIVPLKLLWIYLVVYFIFFQLFYILLLHILRVQQQKH